MRHVFQPLENYIFTSILQISIYGSCAMNAVKGVQTYQLHRNPLARH